MITKTRLAYWICITTIGLGGAPIMASEPPKSEGPKSEASQSGSSSKCTEANFNNYMDCASLAGNAGIEENKQCFKDRGMDDAMVSACTTEMKNRLLNR